MWVVGLVIVGLVLLVWILCFIYAAYKERKKEKVKVFICPNCKAENPENAKYCNNCGKGLKPE